MNAPEPIARAWPVIRKVGIDTFEDGFIHAGNLAYLSMLAIFPFFILGAALFDLIGGRDNANEMIDAVSRALPYSVASVIVPVAEDVIFARSGWLLWVGALVGLWTVSSLVETIRDILRRAYNTGHTQALWKTRLFSFGLILAAVVVLMISLFAQVMIGTAQEVIGARYPQLAEVISTLRISRLVPGIGLAASLYVLFATLTPRQYRHGNAPRWPGALFTAVWWVVVSAALPMVLRQFFTYDLTYGSLAGSMATLFFFWLVGLGLVIGAQLNAALALTEPGTAAEPAKEMAQ